MSHASIADQLHELKPKLNSTQNNDYATSAQVDAESRKPTPSAASTQAEIDERVNLLRMQAKKERAATWQSIAMAVLTAMSAVAVGATLWQGRPQERKVNPLPQVK